MSRRRNVNKSDYSQLNSATFDTADGIDPEQFTEPIARFPLKQVILIVCFMVIGATCITFSILISIGYFDGKYEDRVWPLLLAGILMFIPGGYYGYILLCILFKRDGFSYDDIPIF